MFTDGHQREQTRLKTVLQHESAALALFEIEGNTAETTHVEESFVLDLANTRVM